MNKKNLYTEAMAESIKNSGMWLKEAKILAKKGSQGHAQALLIFAGEELGKAVHCWFVKLGVFPTNHPDVDFEKKDKHGIFRSHPLKSATTMGFMMGLSELYSSSDDESDKELIDPFTNAPGDLHEILAKMGVHAAWARMRWMYVDIVEEHDGFEVVSPLNKELASLQDGIKDMERILNVFKELARREPHSEELQEWIKSTSEFLIKNDKRYPKKPILAS